MFFVGFFVGVLVLFGRSIYRVVCRCIGRCLDICSSSSSSSRWGICRTVKTANRPYLGCERSEHTQLVVIKKIDPCLFVCLSRLKCVRREKRVMGLLDFLGV